MPIRSSQKIVELLGARVLGCLRYVGGMSILFVQTVRWVTRGIVDKKVRLDLRALSLQTIRVGVNSLGIVGMVQIFIGAILALQLSPTLKDYGQEAQIASIIGIGGFRMLGPIFTAIILSGFAGASIAAEIGTMVVAEEIEAMEAMAMNPVRFLVVPRTLATMLAMILLTSFADLMIALGGYVISFLVLGPTVYTDYWRLMRDALKYEDYFGGLIQGAVFGVLIGLIACYEGLKVRGGAEGVGRATTMTVVYSIVAVVLAAAVCTVIFYTFGF
jgi:phospholipid/cholesterol/gamma-HCH transport system permease protein